MSFANGIADGGYFWYVLTNDWFDSKSALSGVKPLSILSVCFRYEEKRQCM